MAPEAWYARMTLHRGLLVMRMTPSFRLLARAVPFALAVTACTHDATTSPVPVAKPTGASVATLHVQIVGLPDTLGAGDVAVFEVRVLDDSGHAVPGVVPTLTSSDPSI